MRAIAEAAELEPVLSVSARQCQQLPLWTRRARMGNQIRKLCRGNVVSAGSSAASKKSPLPKKGTVQLQHLCGLCSSQMACSSHLEGTEDSPENFSPLSDSKNHKNAPLLPPTFLVPCLHIASHSIHKALCLLLPATDSLSNRNWRFGMTMILARLAMDLWHGLLLSGRINTFGTVCLKRICGSGQ